MSEDAETTMLPPALVIAVVEYLGQQAAQSRALTETLSALTAVLLEHGAGITAANAREAARWEQEQQWQVEWEALRKRKPAAKRKTATKRTTRRAA